MAELLKIYQQNPEMRKIAKVIECLDAGGLVIYPTDTVYGIGCDLHNKRAVEKLMAILGMKPKTINLSFICYDLSQMSHYIRPISTQVFKILKKALPGPYTFLLKANNEVPKILNVSKKTVGIRIPNNNTSLAMVRELGRPIISASLKDEDEIVEYIADPEVALSRFKNKVDIVIDGGVGSNIPSTVVDLTCDNLQIIRYGAGSPDLIL